MGGGQARKCMPFNSNRLPVSGVSGPVRENKQLSMSGTRILAFDYPCVVAIHQHWQLGQGSVLCMHVCARTCIYVWTLWSSRRRASCGGVMPYGSISGVSPWMGKPSPKKVVSSKKAESAFSFLATFFFFDQKQYKSIRGET